MGVLQIFQETTRHIRWEQQINRTTTDQRESSPATPVSQWRYLDTPPTPTRCTHQATTAFARFSSIGITYFMKPCWLHPLRSIRNETRLERKLNFMAGTKGIYTFAWRCVENPRYFHIQDVYRVINLIQRKILQKITK
jgi:hypothetical protein